MLSSNFKIRGNFLKIKNTYLHKEIVTLVTATTILFFFHSLIVSSFSIQVDWLSNVGFFDKGLYLNRFYSDFFIALGIASLFYGRRNSSRILSSIILFLFLFLFFNNAVFSSFQLNSFASPEPSFPIHLCLTEQPIYSNLCWVSKAVPFL